MASAAVHSERTSDPQQPHDVVVLGDSPVARGVREELDARKLSDKSHSPHRFSGVRAVIVAAHLGNFEQIITVKQDVRRAEIEERAEQIVLDAAIAAVPHIVVISSAMVSGQWVERPIIRDEDPADPVRDGFVSDVTCFENALFAALEALPAPTRPKVSVLRAAAIAGPGIDTLVTRHFEAPRVLVIKGVDKRWQFVHIKDVASAARTCIEQGLEGILVVGAVTEADGGFEVDELTTQEVLSIGAMRSIELSVDTAFATATKLHKVGVLPAPPTDMELAVYPWSVFPERLLDAGWRPEVSSQDCLRLVIEETRGKFGVGGRRVGHKDAAALGAAGAAVALLSTAALWRQGRK